MPPARAGPGNPDWVEWIEQHASDLEEKGLKSAQSFKKAASALRSNPVAFDNPEDARMLTGVGDATVKILRRKMEQRAKTLGLPLPDRVAVSPPKRRAAPTTASTSDAGTTSKKKQRRTQEQEEAEQDALREARRQKAMGIVAPPTGALGFQAHPDGAFRDLPEEEENPTTTRGGGGGGGGGGGKKPREYLPKKNSGPYALLIALYLNSSYEEPSNPSTKDRLKIDAQPYSTTSFESGSATRDGQARQGGGFTYTAWSGMSILTAKGLVVAEQRRPARYYLTEGGYQLAERLVESAGLEKHVRPAARSSSPPRPLGPGSSLSLSRPAPLGLGGRHPSSSEAPAVGSYSYSSRAFAGRGQPLGGGSASGVHPYSTNVHEHLFRPRSPTPDDFLFEPAPPPRQSRDDYDGDLQLEEDTRRAIAMSMSDTSAAGDGDDLVARIARQAARRDVAGGGASSSSGRRLGGSDEGGTGSGFRPAPAVASGSSSINLHAARRVISGAFAAPTLNDPVPPPSIANVDNAFGYFYLDENDRRTKLRTEAEVSQPDGTELWYRIEYRTAQDLHAMVRGLRTKEQLVRPVPLEPVNKTKSAYIRERVSAEHAPGFPESELGAANKDKDRARPVTTASADPVANLLAGFKDPGPRKSKDAMYRPPPGVQRSSATTTATANPWDPVMPCLPSTSSSSNGIKRTQTLGSNAPPPAPEPLGARPAAPLPLAVGRSSTTVPIRSASPPPRRGRGETMAAAQAVAHEPHVAFNTTSQNPLEACFDPAPGQCDYARHPLDPYRDPLMSDTGAVPRGGFASFRPIVWPAGTFKVYLVVDTRERNRGEGGRRIEVAHLLKTRAGVRADGKMLPLGDMIWVARRIDPVSGEPLSNGDHDVVLDAIVERKTWEDLTSSIQDGRYHSQKVRLKNSGITERIYMIEKHGDITSDSSMAKAHRTCKAELQVNDGFFVHESANNDETLNCLTKRTRIMAEMYENQEIRVIPDHMIERRTYLALQQHLRSTEPHHRYLTTYATFCALNETDAMLTTRTQWASMVLRINGMSEQKAVQFLNRWDTLAKFYHEAKAWERDVDEENEALDRAERERLGAGANGTAKGGHRGGKSNKRRTKHDFVTSNLDQVGPRPIQGALGAKIWDLLMESPRYSS